MRVQGGNEPADAVASMMGTRSRHEIGEPGGFELAVGRDQRAQRIEIARREGRTAPAHGMQQFTTR